MVSITDAYRIAKKYFATNLGKGSIAKATMSDEAWFFISGEPNRESIGNAVISVDKQNGAVVLIDFLSDEGFAQIKTTTPIELPD